VPLLQSILKCPACGFQKQETMPTDACQFFYECAACKSVIRPKAGDCCVFCSYGTVRCPSAICSDSTSKQSRSSRSVFS
jgi:hypothetical protein